MAAFILSVFFNSTEEEKKRKNTKNKNYKEGKKKLSKLCLRLYKNFE